MIYRYYLILIYIFKLVTLTSNVDNLKKKLEEANATSQAAKSAMDKKIAENFDIEEKIANLKKEGENARKSAEEVKSKAKREEQAAKDKVADLESRLAVSYTNSPLESSQYEPQISNPGLS